MSRMIIPEEQPKEVLINDETDNQVEVKEERVIISSDELEKLFQSWDGTGNDLIINESLAGRIEEYLSYQEKIKPLKIKLAEEMFEDFVINRENSDGNYMHNIYINSELIGKFPIHTIKDSYSYMRFEDFRTIAICLNNHMAHYAYMEESLKKIINVRAWITANGGKYKETQDSYDIYIELHQ